MSEYERMNKKERALAYQEATSEYESLLEKHLNLNMARGKPSTEQVDMVSDMLSVLTDPADCIVDGVDVRNYGELAGLPNARAYWADVLGCKPEETFVGGTSSLALMYDVISRAYSHGLYLSERPWCREERVRFLCPSPGYDRHFRITESFGVEMVTVPMTEEGPDMDVVLELIQDPLVKGIWCVPKYSNPQGITYSDRVIRALAGMKPAARDFALIWDNAYCVHEFDGPFVPFPDILSLCREAGNPHMAYEFASTSKITFPGGGISVAASSVENIKYMTKLLSIEMISYDKVNQLRHVLYLKNKEHTLEIMRGHARIMKPKFDMVCQKLEEKIAPLGFAQWNKPTGGYFVSLDTMPGTAKRTLALCKQAGVVMTDAGAAFPYGMDLDDRNIRIAPSYPTVEELALAMDVLCVSLKMAALEKLIEK